MKTLIKNVMHFAVKSFYPSSPYCACCGKIFFNEEKILCDSCAKVVFRPFEHYCSVCGRPLKGGAVCNICYENKHAYDGGVSLFEYNEYSSPIIHSIKYSNNIELAVRLGALLSYDICAKTDFLYNTDIIIAIPLHKDRQKGRGYNQAEKIAFGLAGAAGIEKRDDILIKVKQTKDQIGLKKSEREKNLYESFDIADKNAVKDKNILLIDDVFTTGATIGAASDILKKQGAKKVFFAVLASKTY